MFLIVALLVLPIILDLPPIVLTLILDLILVLVIPLNLALVLPLIRDQALILLLALILVLAITLVQVLVLILVLINVNAMVFQKMLLSVTLNLVVVGIYQPYLIGHLVMEEFVDNMHYVIVTITINLM
jgi:hypothetical protein